MRIHEYQAKRLLAQAGITMPRGEVAYSPEEAANIAGEIGGRTVVKAQVHAGGRGKAGGIRLAGSPSEAQAAAAVLLGKRLVTHQTLPQGLPVDSVLVEEAPQVAQEFYLGVAMDGSAGMPVLMGSRAGGMDIEEVAAKSPEQVIKVWVDPATGWQAFHGRRLAYGLGLPEAAKAVSGLYRTFRELDCSLAEVNPLARTADGRLLALDVKLNFDDNALYRHPELAALRDLAQEDAVEVEAKKNDLSTYIKLDGSVGCIVNGAGLAMATLDIIKREGGEPANFLDIGAASEEKVISAFRIMARDAGVRAVLVNIFGGITRADVIARGVVRAYRELELALPLVVRLAGTNLEEGRRILKESGVSYVEANDLAEAARRAVGVAGGAKGR